MSSSGNQANKNLRKSTENQLERRQISKIPLTPVSRISENSDDETVMLRSQDRLVAVANALRASTSEPNLRKKLLNSGPSGGSQKE